MTNGFTSHPATTMYIDINSCFATIEQQANPHLRGKPVVVAAYTGANGCILAASREAKTYGIKTGMRVYEAKRICPSLVVLPPDPEKYRYVNERLTMLLQSYSGCVQVQSIDEMIIKMPDPPAGEAGATCQMLNIAKEIKKRIREEIGVWITVSIGIAPNAFLAKTASNLKKPDGLEVISKANIELVLTKLALTDLCGIKKGNAVRLITHGITTPLAMYHASSHELQRAFGSIIGDYWWLWLHGYEGGFVYSEQSPEDKKSFSQSCALTRHMLPEDHYTIQVAYQLVAKMASRLRSEGHEARCLWAGCLFTDGTFWHKRRTLKTPIFATEQVFFHIKTLLAVSPKKPIHTVFVGVSDITPTLYVQLPLDEDGRKTIARTQAIDCIYRRFGQNAISLAIALHAGQEIKDRIAFGRSSL